MGRVEGGVRAAPDERAADCGVDLSSTQDAPYMQPTCLVRRALDSWWETRDGRGEYDGGCHGQWEGLYHSITAQA